MIKKLLKQSRTAALFAIGTLALANLPTARAQTTFFADSFDRTDNYDLDAETNGMSGILVSAGVSGVGTSWIEPVDDGRVVPEDSQAIGTQLQMGGNGHAVYLTYNRDFSTLISSGTISVSMDIVSGPTGGTPLHRHLGLGVGFTLAEGNVNSDRQLMRNADLFVAETGNGLIRINDENPSTRPTTGDVVPTTTIDLDPVGTVPIAGTLRIDLTVTNLAAGSTVSYDVLFNSGAGFSNLTSRSFVLSDNYEFYIGIDERSVAAVRADNFSIVSSSYTAPPVNSIVWRATTDNSWDSTTTNWIDGALGLNEYAFFSGADVAFNDVTASTSVNVTEAVSPGNIAINNINSNYTFSGSGSIGGSGALTKLGASPVTMNLSNSFSGGSTISSGVLEMGTDDALGTGVINLTSGALASSGGDRTIANPLLLQATSDVLVSNANFTFTGPVASEPGNYDLHVRGGGVLTIKDSYVNPAGGGLDVHSSRVVIDGAFATNVNDGIRLYTEGTTAELDITNNAVYVLGTLSGSPNVRLGQVADDPGTGIIRISSGSIEMGPTAVGILIGPANNSTGMLYQTGGSILWFDNGIGNAGVKVGNATGAYGEYHMDGGSLVTPTISGASDATGIFYANGGSITVATNTQLDTFISTVSLVLESGGAAIDNAGYDATITSPVSGTGPLTVSGAGSLTLAGTNTYTGTTAVSDGTLGVVLPAASVNVQVADGASLAITVSTSPGGTWGSSSISYAGNGGLDFTSVTGGMFPASLLTTTTLNLGGVVTVGVSGTDWPLGTTKLLDYGSIAGGGSIAFAPLPVGFVGYLTNNPTDTAIELVVSFSPATLNWYGYTASGSFGGLWDVATTANWDFGANQYNQSALLGDKVIFDYLTSPNLNVEIVTNVLPAGTIISNEAFSDFVFYGPGKIGGGGALSKALGGVLTMYPTNEYTGGSTITGGRVRAANDAALGSGPITIGGGGLSSDSSTARLFTNALTITQGGAILGDTNDTGSLTFTSPVNFDNGSRNITVNSDTVFEAGTGGNPGESINQKLGPATLTIKGQNDWNSSSDVFNGTLIVDGAIITNSDRVIPDAQGFDNVARLVITNGGVVVTTGTVNNLRVGRASTDPGTNYVDLAGVYSTPNADINNGYLYLDTDNSLYSELNVLPGGAYATRGVGASGAGAGPTRINLDGGTLSGITNNPNWFEGLTETFVRSGGANFDDGGFVIGITQNLLDGGGSGGLTKTGSGALLLNGTNSYTGTTLVSEGALGGTGIVSGPVSVAAGAALAPGASIGTLTINNNLTLDSGSAVIAEVNKDDLTKDLVAGLVDVSYSGTLIVTNLGTNALVGGETFQLFSASGSKSGNFSAVTVLPATGATGTFDPVTGVVTIGAPSTPTPTNITFSVAGGNIILDWPDGLGWKLEAQTNTLGVGLSTNWSEVVGATPPLTNSVGTADGTVFYRLAY